MKNVIAEAVLAQHTAVLGKTGAGKTNTVKVMVEQVAREGARVCVLDTIKSDHWGLTLDADGHSPGLPFKILGGPHGHVPLHSSAGKAIGQLVGSGKLPLSIVDMADFEAGGVQRFFVEFAQALLKAMTGVVYLVVEEAHEVAPKERAGFGGESMAIHYAKKISTAGRSKGIRLIVATQRVQSLHNAVLGSCETVVAHRLTTPADQGPVLKWLQANVTKAQATEVAATLSSLPTGTGWICGGEARLFEQVAFPKCRTYDNAATPTGKDKDKKVEPPAVDQAELRAIIGDAVKEAEENDPKRLHAEIARLKAGQAKAPPPDRAAIEQARAVGFEEGRAAAVQGIAKLAVEMEASVGRAEQACADVRRLLSSFATFTGAMAEHITAKAAAPARPAAMPAALPAPKSEAPPSFSPPIHRTGNGSADKLTGPQLALLKSLAWWAAMHHDGPTRTQVAAVAGWKPKGSNLRNRLSELSSLGLVTYPSEGRVSLTPEGAAEAPAPDLNVTLIDCIRSILTGPQGTVFETLLDAGGTVGRTEVATRINWEPGGSNLRNRLSELSALEVVEYPSKGGVRLQQWVTE